MTSVAVDQKQPFHKVQSSNLSGFNPSIPKRPDNRALGRHEARFVVGASAKNPVAVFVSCHRVIKKRTPKLINRRAWPDSCNTSLPHPLRAQSRCFLLIRMVRRLNFHCGRARVSGRAAARSNNSRSFGCSPSPRAVAKALNRFEDDISYTSTFAAICDFES